jgi:hypothetical protein
VTAAPNVGDKVVYCGPRNDWGWADRQTSFGIVVEVDHDETVSVRVWATAEGEWWGAPASSVRVVERAAYTPAGTDRRDVVIAAAEELTEARRIVAGLTDRSVDTASVSDHAGDVGSAVREYEAHAADALARLGYKDGA